MNRFALSVLTPYSPLSLVTLHLLLCCLSRFKTEADTGIVSFHITFREFVFFHIQKVKIFFVVQDV